MTTAPLSAVVDYLTTGWRILLIILALAALVGAQARTPEKLDVHIAQTDSVLIELRHLNQNSDKQLCLSKADHRHTDWTNCLQ